MKQFKILKNEIDFAEASRSLDELQRMEKKTSKQLNDMYILSLLLDDYQKNHGAEIPLPTDPIEAIRFRLEQLGQRQKYLRQFIGSPSKVSEVMKRKIGLSLQMIRSLHEGLGIPAEILLQDSRRKLSQNPFQAKDYPFVEMFKRGYFHFVGTLSAAKEVAAELLTDFFSILPPNQQLMPRFRKTAGVVTDLNALKAWQCRVLHKVQNVALPQYDRKKLPKNFLHSIAAQSRHQYGPQNVKELLNEVGIHLIYEPHFPRTRLDGAAFMLPDGHPVIAMTLRHDRLDNYWFTLIHELHHVLNDLPEKREFAFLDDTDHAFETLNGTEQDATLQDMEKNADQAARDALIPPQLWSAICASACGLRNENLVRSIAQQRQISPAVLAGRIRWETRNYSLFQGLLGKCREQLMPQEEHNTDIMKQGGTDGLE